MTPHGIARLVTFVAPAMFAGLGLAHAASTGNTIRSLNGENPQIHIRAAGGESLTASYLNTYAEHDAGLSLYGPDGRLFERDSFAWNTGSGSATYDLDHGAGDYRVVVSEFNYTWSFDVPDAQLVIEPKRRWSTFRLEGADTSLRFYFEVPADTSSFTLHGNGFGTSGTIKLYRPDDALHATISVGTDEADDSRTVTNPTPGMWYWTGSGRDLGVWLTELPNVFAPGSSDNYFDPTTPAPASASLSVGSSTLGSSGWTAVEFVPHTTGSYSQIAPELEWLGFKAVRLLLGDEIEQPNDNGDPNVLDTSRLDFAGWAYDGLVDEFRDRGVEFFLPVLDMDQLWMSSWNTNPPWPQNQVAEFAEYCLAVIRHAAARNDGITHWEVFNEPEWQIGEDGVTDPALVAAQYVALFAKVRDRVRADPDPEVNSVRLGGPALGSATYRYFSDDIMIALLEAADADVDFLSWHTYTHGDLDDTWRFGADMDRVDTLRQTYGDLVADEELVLTEHNTHPGTPVVPEILDSHASSLYYASSLIQRKRSGRDFMMTYYELLDESTQADGSKHKKGLIAGTFPQYTRKPVAYAARLVNRVLQESVVTSSSDHVGLELIATYGDDVGDETLTLLIANTSTRDLEVAAAPIATPLTGTWYRAIIGLTQDAPTAYGHAAITTQVDAGAGLSLSHTFPARSVSAIVYTRANPDGDGDDVSSLFDNCPADANSGQEDADGDGIGDACSSDDDGDGIDDALDNCDAVANAGQVDSDGDAVGDACDVCPLDADPGQVDSDADGVGDGCDLCPATANHTGGYLKKVSLSRLSAPNDDDRLNGLEARDLTDTAIDPLSEEVALRLYDSDGDILAETLAHPATDTLWRSSPVSGEPKKAWQLKNRDYGLFGGISQLKLQRTQGTLRLKMKARDRDLSGADRTAVGVSLRIGSGAGADCWDLAIDRCTLSSGKLICK